MSKSVIGNIPGWPIQLVMTCLLGCLRKKGSRWWSEEKEEDAVATLDTSERGDCNRHFRKQS